MMQLLGISGVLLCSLLGQAAATSVQQTREAVKPVRNIAIIGAGAAGSSAAYHIRKYADEGDLAVNITIFERTDRVGGRALTVHPFGNRSEHVELGAAIFIKVNEILYNATQEFDLDIRRLDDDMDGIMAIWDGEKVLFQINQAHSSWWNMSKMVWRYGYRALTNSEKLMKAAIQKFLRLYTAPYFPFRSLTQRTYELGLLEETSLTGEEYLRKHNIPELLSHEFIQALTRVNYASNLANIHGLDTLVATAPEQAMSVVGGNWRIFSKMVSAAGAAVQLNTSVTSIELDPNDADPAKLSSKYVLQTQTSGEQYNTQQPVLFDDVVIAAPYQFSNISAGDGVIEHPIDEIPYITLHVTLFASPFQLSPIYFNLPPTAEVPSAVLTTLAEKDEPTSGVQGAGTAGFYSVTVAKKVVNPKTGKQENIYKIFSPEKVTQQFLGALLGVPIPESFVGRTEDSEEGTQMIEPISWYHPHVFHSYPKAFPRMTFQDPIIRAGLYYTSGMESFISCMETNAMMGMNVARLIVDDALGVMSGAAVTPKDTGVGEDDQQQKVLKNQQDTGKPAPVSTSHESLQEEL